MDKILSGGKRRYHLEDLLSTDTLGVTYRAFARRKAGKGIKRRYYALTRPADNDSSFQFLEALQQTLITSPNNMHIDEDFECDGHHWYVVAKGSERKNTPQWVSALTNKGYLMLLLSALILILLIIKFFQ